jgi:hypothetical protein
MPALVDRRVVGFVDSVVPVEAFKAFKASMGKSWRNPQLLQALLVVSLSKRRVPGLKGLTGLTGLTGLKGMRVFAREKEVD